VKRVLILLALLVVLPYARTAVYDFPEPRPFAGPAFFNPYRELTGVWQRANLHAHGRPWRGFTNGRHSADEVVAAYRRQGYAVAGVSDYQHIAAKEGTDTLPLYEHGYNLGKRHQLVVGARDVLWFDFPLAQTRSQQQLIIDLVGRSGDLVAIAHPEGRDAYSLEDMRQLTGYQLIEVVNGPFIADKPWDAALSAGRLVWALANDDNHDLNERGRFTVAWNMIDARSASTEDIVEALRAGRSYAVLRTDEIPTAEETRMTSLKLDDGTLTVTWAGAPSIVAFFGQNGEQRKSVRNATTATYTFDERDTYIRAVIYSPRTIMFLNPVFRYDGVRIPAPAAQIDSAATWTMRSSVIGAVLALGLLLRRRDRVKRVTVTGRGRPTAADAVDAADTTTNGSTRDARDTVLQDH
jgi:hypothetical protein